MQHFCNYCNKACIKKGVRNSVQKYLCKLCGKYQQHQYSYKKFDAVTEKNMISLLQEGLSISSISRLVKKSKSVIQRKLFALGNLIKRPLYNEHHQSYELDEMTLTIAGSKDVYLIYAINRKTRKVIDFFVGRRTKVNIKKVVDSVLSYSPKVIFTDGLNSYPSLISKTIHRSGRRLTNRIERMNLTLRNFVKRLSRSTICFSKNIEMLDSHLRIYLWGKL